MVISSPNLARTSIPLTPALIRGMFLIWRSELQSGKQLADIREFDRETPGPITARAPEHDRQATGIKLKLDRAFGRDDLASAFQWA